VRFSPADSLRTVPDPVETTASSSMPFAERTHRRLLPRSMTM